MYVRTFVLLYVHNVCIYLCMLVRMEVGRWVGSHLCMLHAAFKV